MYYLKEVKARESPMQSIELNWIYFSNEPANQKCWQINKIIEIEKKMITIGTINKYKYSKL